MPWHKKGPQALFSHRGKGYPILGECRPRFQKKTHFLIVENPVGKKLIPNFEGSTENDVVKQWSKNAPLRSWEGAALHRGR